ncbi:MAG: hypothetical protein KL801_12525 [Mesorhizobium sp.]|nr:hypothetical protein [Mesorhizobium sp.]
MTMRLASDDIVIEHGGNAVRLRPSLRAAYRLDHRHGGFGRVFAGILEANVTVIADIIAECSDNDPAARRLLMGKVAENGVRDLQHLADPLFNLLAACYGVSADDEHPAEKRERVTGKPFNMRRSLEDLFAVATGWLGWSADDALNATVAQIIAARDGHIAKLHAIYGGGEEKKRTEYDPQDLPSDAEVREGIAKLKAMTGAGKS